MGAFDGHNVKSLEAALNEAKLAGEPVIVHVCTHKGHGYAFAEEKPEIYHSVSSFDKEKGITEDEHRAADNEYSGFSQCFGSSLLKIAERNSDVVAITAAMCEGTGLTDFKKKFPERFFDVGIAEQYAATFAARLAASGKRPVFAVYSSFLQRSYDQLIHDVSAQSLPVVFAVDRAGLVPGDGITHQGVFDLAFSLSIPGFSVYTPETYSDLENSLENALASNLPSIVRYNKGNEPSYPREQFTDKGEYRIAHFGEGKTVNLISYGRTVKNAYDAAMLLKDKYEVRVVSILRVKPFDAVKLFNDLGNNGLTVFIEEQVRSGCFGEKTVSTLAEHGMHFEKVAIVALDEEFPTHAAVDQLHKKYGMDADSVTALVEEKMAK
jgi:1-deoxy-D-xylulose-5-phosphate synthase